MVSKHLHKDMSRVTVGVVRKIPSLLKGHKAQKQVAVETVMIIHLREKLWMGNLSQLKR